MQTELRQFAQKIAKNGLTEVGCAVALMWFLERGRTTTEVTPAYLAELMHDLALKGRVNLTRFREQLLRNSDVIKGKTSGSVRLRLASKSRLDDKYLPLCRNSEPVQTDDHLIRADLFATGPAYLARLVAEINGCYHYGFYNGCAVLCRRLMERLLISAFEKQGHGSAIRDGLGEYMALADIIGRAASGHHIKLSRGTQGAMSAIKSLGDLGAHHPFHMVRQREVDDHRLDFAKVISELDALAK
ncbi:hypothetical protein J6524_25140 [Bradyrhizobium sp. WSM 1738]|uniref:hypothetical protein n=1 Tax=Bradyrhizobium hereditatis TaxID=2821405 RepID=UPI001CE303C2|nr:hypothetical protein [Bradyrhizobium hereditatis]MCA6118137.1 hypothetical protein [Bradyrhizobium hereditatis]